MRVKIKGLNSVKTRLADGSTVIYWYAWKGGPRLVGQPGSEEFMASYYEAVQERRVPTTGTLFGILKGYQASTDYSDLADRTRADYAKQILIIEKEFGAFPLGALTDRRARGAFLAWRDKLAARSRRQADYAWTVLARVLSWALNRGLVEANPCEKGGRLYRATRADKVWTHDDEAAVYASAPEHLHLPLMLALWTGQRQGDLLKLAWSNYDGAMIRLRQSKTGTRVSIPVGAPLKAMLDAEKKKKKGALMLLNSNDEPWTPDGFRSSWSKACKAAGVEGLTFNDLRGTAVTRLAILQCTVPEIASITGHSLRDVSAILDVHYLHRDPKLAESAIRKLERGTQFSK